MIWSTGQIWAKPDHEKGNRLTVGHLCICPTTQPLNQGTGKEVNRTCVVKGWDTELAEKPLAVFWASRPHRVLRRQLTLAQPSVQEGLDTALALHGSVEA